MKILFRYRGGLFLAALAFAFFALLPSISQASSGYGYIDSKTGGLNYEWEGGSLQPGPKGDNEYNALEKDVHLLGFDKISSNTDFTFEFYGRTYYGVYLGGNGYLTFAYRPNTNETYDGIGIPSKSGPNALIAPLWGSYDTFD
ncbi:MAG: hypothetical protein J7L25_06785 [Deltaproteobacteria bacterium]|nr:hypothetical protein [Candidatus Tharpella aukensis]